MTDLERRRNVCELALLATDRTRTEQQALLQYALRLDNDANRLTVNNSRPRGEPAFTYVLAVEATWEPAQICKPVTLTAKQRSAWELRVERWEGRAA